MKKVSGCCGAGFKPSYKDICAKCGKECDKVKLSQLAKALEAPAWILAKASEV